jgi:hypothetical protein
MPRTTHGARTAVAPHAVVLVLALLASRAAAQAYRATDLTPPGLPAGAGASIRSVTRDGTEAVGYVELSNGLDQAARWDLAAGGRYTALHPEGYRDSSASGSAGGRQVGWAFDTNLRTYHGLVWSGAAQGFINVNPPGATHSTVNGTDGRHLVGGASFGNTDTRAMVWAERNGTWFSTDITPAGYRQATVTGVDGSRQVGSGGDFVFDRALLWELTPESAVELHPPGAASSQAVGVRGNEQVGWAGTGAFFANHATLWRGTAASAVDLHPAGFRYSQAHATNGRQQVGWATTAGLPDPLSLARATVWSGTADSAIDLHAFLDPDQFKNSIADAIDDFGNVYGMARDMDNVRHPIVWTAVPEPGAAAGALAALLLLGRRRAAPRV